MNNKIIQHVKVHLPHRILPSATVWISNGKLKRIEPTQEIETIEGDDERIDGNGMWLIPGMIDVHIHGANGYDMMDGTEDSIQEVSRSCAATGCTSFLATSVSSTIEDLMNMIRSVKVSSDENKGQGSPAFIWKALI